MSNPLTCDHPLENKWGELPAVEVFSLYEWDGKLCLDPDGTNDRSKFINLHCSDCGTFESVHLDRFVL